MEQSCEFSPFGQGLLAVTIILFILTTILILLRIVVRVRIVKGFGWDDFTILIAYCFCVGVSAMVWRMFVLGFGHGGRCLDSSRIEGILKLLDILESIALVSMTFSRLSIVLFILRILGNNRWFRRFLCGWAVYMTVQQLIMAGLSLMFCAPAQAAWDPEAFKTAQCWSPTAVFASILFIGITAVLSDLILALTPIHFLYKLQLPIRKRLGLAALMALGLIPSACSIARTIYLVEADFGENPRADAIFQISGILEMHMLIICASIPTIVPLYHKLRYGRKSSTDQQYLQRMRPTRVTRTMTPQRKDAGAGAQTYYIQGNKQSRESSAEALQTELSMGS